MARRCEVIEVPMFGELMTFLDTPADTNRELVRLQLVARWWSRSLPDASGARVASWILKIFSVSWRTCQTKLSNAANMTQCGRLTTTCRARNWRRHNILVLGCRPSVDVS
jgi:hypothetical protein